jgi:hypothetical protein
MSLTTIAAGDMVSANHCVKHPVVVGGRAYKFTTNTIYRWVKHCLVLGRPLTHEYRRGRGPRLYVSLPELQSIARMMNNPCGKPLPGNDGAWLANGIYRQEGTLWFSPDHLETLHGIDADLWRDWTIRKGHPAFAKTDNRGRPRHLQPQWPSRKNPHGGTKLAIHEDDVQRILDWRQARFGARSLPGADGTWLADELFRDADGQMWVTKKWIKDNKGKTKIFAYYWHTRGLLPSWVAGRPGRRMGRGRVLVYSLDAVERLLARDQDDPGQRPQAVAAINRGRKGTASALDAGRGSRAILERLRAAIVIKGREAKPRVIIREAQVRAKAGRKGLRELERLGEYAGFEKGRPSRWVESTA